MHVSQRRQCVSKLLSVTATRAIGRAAKTAKDLDYRNALFELFKNMDNSVSQPGP
jgi:hypothetical protein